MADMVAQTSETLGGASGGDGGDGGLMSRVSSTTAEASEAQTVARVSRGRRVIGSGFEAEELQRVFSCSQALKLAVLHYCVWFIATILGDNFAIFVVVEVSVL